MPEPYRNPGPTNEAAFDRIRDFIIQAARGVPRLRREPVGGQRMKTITIDGVDGAAVLRYLVIDDEMRGRIFYGGDTQLCDRAELLDQGPHTTHYANSLLDLIGRLANTGYETYPYRLRSDFSATFVDLRPEMMADDIAEVLGIDVQVVLDRYSLLVRPPKEPRA